jgi:hypothetical protein
LLRRGARDQIRTGNPGCRLGGEGSIRVNRDDDLYHLGLEEIIADQPCIRFPTTPQTARAKAPVGRSPQAGVRTRCPTLPGLSRQDARVGSNHSTGRSKEHPEVPIPAAPGAAARSSDTVGRGPPRTPRAGRLGCQLAGRDGILLRFRSDPARGMGPRSAINRTLNRNGPELELVEHPACPQCGLAR